jgi:hypothetical protein
MDELFLQDNVRAPFVPTRLSRVEAELFAKEDINSKVEHVDEV